MKHGSEWYKREPIAFLGGVQGMTAKEHAVYSVVLDLIYQHGGSVNNDPSWFAGWIKDMGSSSVRKTIAELVSREKLFITGDQISQKRAKTEAKTKENLRETRAESGKKGGINSGKSRAATNENKDLTEANVAPREEKRRVDKKEEAKASLSPSALCKIHFQDFWDSYPHRDGKRTKRPDAEKSFIKAIAGGASVDQIAAGVEALKRDPDVLRGYGRGPVPWLNQKGWTDEIPQQSQFKASNGGLNGQADNHQSYADRPNHRSDATMSNILRIAGNWASRLDDSS